jgi:thioredoxin-like negative regulator of GroEL
MAVLPWLQDIAQRRLGLVKIGLVHADKEFFFARRFGVTGVPKFILYRRGRKLDELDGAPQAKEQLLAWIDRVL